jgi:hypothetical protein
MVTNFIVSISNRANCIFEVSNVIFKREQFYKIERLGQVVELMNERYFNKEDRGIVAKIINLDNQEQLIIEIMLYPNHQGLFVRKSNPNKDIIYNSDPKNSYTTEDIKALFPLKINELKKINLVKLFFDE